VVLLKVFYYRNFVEKLKEMKLIVTLAVLICFNGITISQTTDNNQKKQQDSLAEISKELPEITVKHTTLIGNEKGGMYLFDREMLEIANSTENAPKNTG
jgi:hypothetical protein